MLDEKAVLGGKPPPLLEKKAEGLRIEKPPAAAFDGADKVAREAGLYYRMHLIPGDSIHVSGTMAGAIVMGLPSRIKGSQYRHIYLMGRGFKFGRIIGRAIDDEFIPSYEDPSEIRRLRSA